MKRNDVLLILIPSLLFVTFWIVFNIYHNYQSSTITETVDTQINAITPSFDTQTIDLLKSRTQINPDYQINPGSQTVLPSSSSAIPVAPVTITPTVTVNPQQASAGGSLTP